jgi:hypothetical protein
VVAQYLTVGDLPALLELENEKWAANQMASITELESRIHAHPNLCIGAFCASTGKILASVFLKPVQPDFWLHVNTWDDCVALPSPHRTDSLFGISLSSREGPGADAALELVAFTARNNGWRHIYLGSPVPGLREWQNRNPQGDAETYVHLQRGSLPADPQLRYYHRQGFKQIMSVKPGYFPHDRSLDYGVILRGFPNKHTLAAPVPAHQETPHLESA